MNKINISDSRNKNIAELQQDLLNLLREHFKLRFQRKVGEAPKTHLFKVVRRNIARIKTIINEKTRRANG